MNKQKVPKLRFPGFTGEWQEKRLGDVAPLQRGFDLPSTQLEKGIYPVVYSNGVLNRHKECKAKAPGVVTGRSGTIGNIHYIEEDYWPHNTTLWVTDYFGNMPKFIFYMYNQIRIEQFGTGSGVPTLNRNNVHSHIVAIPTLPEQKKIADFLSIIDTKIEKLTRKKELTEQYKKGAMQKIFSQKIRFKDGNGKNYPDWEEKRLGDVADFFSGGTPTSTDQKYYTGDIPFIKSGEINSISTAQFITQDALGSSSAKLVKKGDLLYALYGATSGEVAISKIDGAINQAVLCIRSSCINNMLLLNFFKSQKQHIINTYLQGGQGNLSAQIVKKLIIDLPCKEEQAKIADFFSNLDKTIEQIQKELAMLKKFKKGLLQGMFV